MDCFVVARILKINIASNRLLSMLNITLIKFQQYAPNNNGAHLWKVDKINNLDNNALSTWGSNILKAPMQDR